MSSKEIRRSKVGVWINESQEGAAGLPKKNDRARLIHHLQSNFKSVKIIFCNVQGKKSYESMRPAEIGFMC